LFGLRLVPAIPFFVINLIAGLTQIRVWTFIWVSAIGMLPTTIIYVNAGNQLMSIKSAADLLSWPLVLALVALALAPFVARMLLTSWSSRKAYARWERPRHADYNLVVIGAGSAGLVAAYAAATAKAKVALIERAEMGGECLSTGCVPSKAIIRSAKLAKEARSAADYGLTGSLEADFPAVMARVRRVIARIAPHDSVERYQGLGVEVVTGSAFIQSPYAVEVGGRTLTTRNIVIATGAAAALPDIPGLAEVKPLTSDTIWSMTTMPQRLLIVGGGPIGCELAQAFARLGCKIILLQSAPRLLEREDPEVSKLIFDTLAVEGVDIHLGIKIDRFEISSDGAVVHLTQGLTIAFDQVLVAAGRRPRLQGFGLEELGLLEDGKLPVNSRMQTRLTNIYAAGDVIGQLQFTHAAGQYGYYATINALFGRLKGFGVDLAAFPAVTYTDPEVARVGLSETEARAKNIPFETTVYQLEELDRAITDEANEGFVKVLTIPGKDRILGVTIVGARAGDMLSEFTFAMKHGLGLKAIFSTIHPYPGWTEGNKAVAGGWRRAHAPGWAFAATERWLKWQRG
jgi:pyruvate/2-oxoglutarate dehydrogenase complex dihydrolipoamide dehydrogenase (E3) component